MRFVTLCPAKINLRLRVLGRTADGYHELDTIFAQLTLADTLSFTPGGAGMDLTCEGLPVDGPTDRNLVLRAAAAYAQASGRPVRGSWHLRKRIPVAAGLGGGSSDAAGVLRILQHWSDRALDRHSLHRLATGLGADVPFFLVGGIARGRGKGELLAPISWPGTLHVLLLTHPPGLSTADVFREYDRRLTRGPSEPTLGAAGSSERGSRLARVARNDLASAAVSLAPHLGSLLEDLRRCGLKVVGLSGSGPTLWGIGRDRTAVRAAADRLRGAGFPVLVTTLRKAVPRVAVVPG